LNGGEPDPGDTLRYTITLIETAGVAASGVSVVDDLAAVLNTPSVVSMPPGAVNSTTGAGTGANGTGQVVVTNIAVPANGSVTVVFNARIAVGTQPATPIDNTAVVTNPGGPGASPAAPQLLVSPSAVPSSGSKPLYLRSSTSVALSRNPPSTDAAVTVTSTTPAIFTLTPTLALPVTLPAGNISAPLWLRRESNSGTNSRTVQVTLSNTVTGTIGTVSQVLTTLNGTGSPTLVTFVIPNPTTATYPAGSAFRVTIEQTAPSTAARQTLVYPVGATAGSFSRVVLNSATVVNVDSVQTYNAPYNGGTVTGSFALGATAYVRAVISDPFGSFDISSARISIIDVNSVVRVSNAVLPQVADSGAATRTYEYAYAIPANAPPGGWTVQVTGIEGTEAVVTDLRVGGFIVLPNLPALRVTKTLDVISDPISGSTNPKQIPGSITRYRVTVTNTGPGTVDASTLAIADLVPANSELVVNGSSTVQFTDGSVPSGLTFNYATNAAFSSQPGGAPPYTYVPVANGNGVDPAVTGLRVAPTGAMAAAAGANQPSFTVEFRIRVR
jgi:uncharacterized repeat protein (TIGR01451 family)